MFAMRKIRWGKYIFLMLVAGFVLVPMFATVLGGFKSLGELRTNPFGLPDVWEFEYYAQVFADGSIWLLMKNSLIIAFFSVLLTLIIGTMTAFTFSHIKFAGYKYIYNYFLIGMMFPAAAAILPLFLKIRDLGLLDSLSGVVIPQVAFGLGFSILLFRSFFEQLPSELFDAARVDGCSYIKFYWHVILPLSTPILATVGVFVLVASWNNYLLPLLVLNTEQQYPWTLGIMQYRGEYGIEWNRILAYVTVTITPAIVFFLFAQKYIVEGLTGGAVKG
ncbi:MAG: carbohydrate ABC transporter permease [Gammaproteobacteria bacterium]|jgi:raffinose/stachyose/melibiose transport system permease protein|uniref:Carbohydrate ABC transporter membrane protein 2, CUT1 family n=1 Tax=Marinomonas polaris DSM 16579 TaxID=1122206 RepID=A0A1M5DRR6_9GAMM|nr:carbohydrate ABC transporter permease [Marinomonas polaris]MBU1295228.1 carbohydrate ABC transporter permease [Gammaproteobacteria bacterium]MBU1468837.1 carbohydrate ABC transporter permease [Gammaproteobacteria bacterium]MBU2318250.1 carbohydrate ABC transporter permease [Gammaproteobacteria bacterium]MBU2412022.1 carbohydrate ABC transporter permease [Gammaproteobacteria bacterium]SHF69564.1 carbohydrate ABC transporter membrane protein 2, CUT1 family [Marinomonas polaris DSM 16579]